VVTESAVVAVLSVVAAREVAETTICEVGAEDWATAAAEDGATLDRVNVCREKTRSTTHEAACETCAWDTEAGAILAALD
jgi:hypothetical protein